MARGVDRELFGELGQIDDRCVFERLEQAFDLTHDLSRVTPHGFVTQCGHQHAELLVFALLGRVEHHALAEDRRHELVGC